MVSRCVLSSLSLNLLSKCSSQGPIWSAIAWFKILHLKLRVLICTLIICELILFDIIFLDNTLIYFWLFAINSVNYSSNFIRFVVLSVCVSAFGLWLRLTSLFIQHNNGSHSHFGALNEIYIFMKFFCSLSSRRDHTRKYTNCLYFQWSCRSSDHEHVLVMHYRIYSSYSTELELDFSNTPIPSPPTTRY